MTNSDSVVSVTHLSKSYRSLDGNQKVLADVSLCVKKGEAVALQGVSGSGKSTLLNLIGGLDTPDSGRILVCGTVPTDLTERQLAEFRQRHLGFVFQRFNLLSGFTALENVLVPLRLERLRGFEAVQKASATLDRVGLAQKLHHRKANELSVGEMQRVAIARAVVRQPSVILADEPTGNLDEENKATVTELLLSLASDETGVVVATHDSSVANQCQRAYLLKSGTLHPVR